MLYIWLPAYIKLMGFILSTWHAWIRIGHYRDYASAKLKIPIDNYIGLAGAVGVATSNIALQLAVLAYCLVFVSFVLFGRYIMIKKGTAAYEQEWLLQFNPPLKRIHDVTNNSGIKEDQNT